MGLASSRKEARQFIRHGHFTLNGKKADIPSIIVKVGDVIAVRERSKNHVQIKEALENAPALPEYVTVDKDKMEGKLVATPLRAQIPVQLQEQLVVEYYSR